MVSKPSRIFLTFRRHSLPFIKPKHGPPPPPLSLDDPPVTPEVTANLFSTLFFNWVSPMMALGSARPLQATDLWKMDEKRSAGLLADRLSAKYHARQQKDIAYNTKLADPKNPLPFPQRFVYPMLPHREKREKDFRTTHGKKKASLAWALSDTFGWYFWSGGLIKVISDASTSTTPIVMRQIISWSTQYHAAMAGAAEYPSIGRGIGMAIGLFCMLCFASIGVHHFFVREYSLPRPWNSLTCFRWYGYWCHGSFCDHHCRVQPSFTIDPKITRTATQRKAREPHLNRYIAYRFCRRFLPHDMDR
jgi:hypothetical protein